MGYLGNNKVVSDERFELPLFFIPNEVPYQARRIGEKNPQANPKRRMKRAIKTLVPLDRIELPYPDYKTGVIPLY